jgi:integrase/recombinase XerD
MHQSHAHAPTLKESYELFLLERQGNRVTQRTIDYYNLWLGDFFRWLDAERPAVKGFEELDVNTMRLYRAHLASRPKANGERLAPISLVQAHRAVGTFLRWASDDDQPVDPRLLRLKAPRIAQPEKTVFTIAQVKVILESAASPTEEMLVRILVGAGLRASEACGLSLNAGDGLSDLMTDSLDRGRAELRVRWDAGAKGQKARRVPITKSLALAMRRYATKYRPQSDAQQLLIGVRGRPFIRWGVDSMMDRIQRRVGFRVHAHAFRHTFATVCTQNDWNLEKLRAAMGHADYSVLQGYVSLAAQRDLGPRKQWAELILLPEIAEQRRGW